MTRDSSAALPMVLLFAACARLGHAVPHRAHAPKLRSSLPTSMDADNAVTAALLRYKSANAGVEARDSVGPPPRYHTVDQDHFDGTNTNTWQQAYYVNDTFWVPGSDAPIYVCVGGEGPAIDGSAVSGSVHCNVAVESLPETKALMFAVEHRFYGCHNASACPVDLSAFEKPGEALRFLSSRQALEDLAAFRAFAVEEYGLAKNKWVSFGGSYPGMLAGWFRLKYPHLVHASVASSAPVKAKLDMNEYNDVTALAYAVSDNNVGGSPECLHAIAGGHATIGEMFNTSAGRERLANLFGHEKADWYKVYAHQGSFAGNGVAYFPAQGNDPSCDAPACNIGRICDIMTDMTVGDPVARLANLSHVQRTWISPKWAEEAAVGDGIELNYWGYQTCTEFAFYQTCEKGSKCMFTQGYGTLDQFTSNCVQEYQIPVKKIAENVALSNIHYGADKPSGECVLYPNGEVDPWHGLGVLTSPSKGIDVMMVGGASHHAWTHPSLPSDQPSVVAARLAIKQKVAEYLSQDCNQAVGQ